MDGPRFCLTDRPYGRLDDIVGCRHQRTGFSGRSGTWVGLTALSPFRRGKTRPVVRHPMAFALVPAILDNRLE